MAPSSPTADAWTGRLVGGRWRIASLLDDSGGMASVYLADDERLPRKAVVKIPKAARFNAEFAERFAREANWHAKVSDRNVVHILDRGEEAGTPFLVLQYLPGGNLKAWCERNPSILADPRLHYESWLLPIAQALDAVAAQGIIHRDVKPSNILFDSGGQAYLSDFGIVRAGDDATMTGTGMFIGTLQFMSPEQCQPEAKRTIDGRSDQYGLAVTAYQVLTGWKYPVEDDTAVVYAAKFGHVAMTPPRAHDPRIPQAVNDAVMRALSADREWRFGSSLEFVKSMVEGFGAAALPRPRPPPIPPVPVPRPTAGGLPPEPRAAATPPAAALPPPLPVAGLASPARAAFPVRVWRWFRGLPDLALAAGLARLMLGVLATVRIYETIRTIWAEERMSEGGYTYWGTPSGVDLLATVVAWCVLAPAVILMGWGGGKGRIGAAVLLGFFVLAHVALAVRGIGPGLEIGDEVSFGWSVSGGSDLGWAMVAGVAGAIALVMATPGRERAARGSEVVAGGLGRGLIAAPVISWFFDTSAEILRDLPLQSPGTLAGTAFLILTVLLPMVAVAAALLTGFKARSGAAVVLFSSMVIFMTAFEVPRQYGPLFFAWLCGLLLIVTAGPGPGSLDAEGGLVSRH